MQRVYNRRCIRCHQKSPYGDVCQRCMDALREYHTTHPDYLAELSPRKKRGQCLRLACSAKAVVGQLCAEHAEEAEARTELTRGELHEVARMFELGWDNERISAAFGVDVGSARIGG